MEAHEQAGRTLPVDGAPLVALAEALAIQPAQIELSDAEGNKSKQSLGLWFEEWLSRLPVQVNYGERSADKGIPKPASLRYRKAIAWRPKALNYMPRWWLAEQKDMPYERALSQLSNT